ncbi:MAG TPA: hypothetical protein VF765_31400 [Polyangiaceae bacterium]
MRAIGFVVPAAGVAACTLVNSFGEVRQAPPADASTDTTGMMETGPMDTGSHDAESGASETSTMNDAGDASFPDIGVIVISGRVSDDAGNLQGVLTAIDPTHGAELPNAREMLNVPVVLYDGVRDIWYIIETNGQSLFPTPSDMAILHAETLDPVSGTWTDLGQLRIPPPVFGLAGVQTNRLVYIGFDNQVDSASGTSFVTLDTTDPTNLSIYASTGLDIQPQGIIATRSQTGNGGPVNMLESVPCPDDGGTGDAGDAGSGGIGGGYCLQIQHVTVPTNPDPATLGFTVPLGPFFGRPAYGAYLGAPGAGSPQDFIAWSLPVPGNPGSPGATSINAYAPLNFAAVGSPISFQTSDGFFQPFAFSECYQQLLLTATNEDLSVYAIPLSSATGKLASQMTTHSGQSLYYEPYTSTVLSPFTQGDGYVLDAYTLGGSASMPSLTHRTAPDWNPPADVRPEVLGIRKPLPITCPP